MSRLIDADKLRSDIIEKMSFLKSAEENLEIMGGCIDDAPTVDAEPIRHGAWNEWWPGDCALIMTGEEMLYECNLCTAKFEDKSRYCPNCGAKMDGGRKE